MDDDLDALPNDDVTWLTWMAALAVVLGLAVWLLNSEEDRSAREFRANWSPIACNLDGRRVTPMYAGERRENEDLRANVELNEARRKWDMMPEGPFPRWAEGCPDPRRVLND